MRFGGRGFALSGRPAFGRAASEIIVTPTGYGRTYGLNYGR